MLVYLQGRHPVSHGPHVTSCPRPWAGSKGAHTLEIESWVDIAKDFVIRLDDLFDLVVDEEVEGVNVLLHQAFDFEECGKQVPFVLRRRQIARSVAHEAVIPTYLGRVDRVRQTLPIVERFQQRVEVLTTTAPLAHRP